METQIQPELHNVSQARKQRKLKRVTGIQRVCVVTAPVCPPGSTWTSSNGKRNVAGVSEANCGCAVVFAGDDGLLSLSGHRPTGDRAGEGETQKTARVQSPDNLTRDVPPAAGSHICHGRVFTCEEHPPTSDTSRILPSGVWTVTCAHGEGLQPSSLYAD